MRKVKEGFEEEGRRESKGKEGGSQRGRKEGVCRKGWRKSKGDEGNCKCYLRDLNGYSSCCCCCWDTVWRASRLLKFVSAALLELRLVSAPGGMLELLSGLSHTWEKDHR